VIELRIHLAGCSFLQAIQKAKPGYQRDGAGTFSQLYAFGVQA